MNDLTHADLTWVDPIRFLMCVVAILLGALVLRLGWMNRHAPPESAKPHFATYLSYSLVMFVLAGIRLGHIGEPATWDLWAALVVVALGAWGVLARVKLPTTRPSKRAKDVYGDDHAER